MCTRANRLPPKATTEPACLKLMKSRKLLPFIVIATLIVCACRRICMCGRGHGAPTHASKPDVSCTGVGTGVHAGGNPVTIAGEDVAHKTPSLLSLLLSCSRAARVIFWETRPVSRPPVFNPLPHVPGRVVKSKTIRAVGFHWCSRSPAAGRSGQQIGVSATKGMGKIISNARRLSEQGTSTHTRLPLCCCGRRIHKHHAPLGAWPDRKRSYPLRVLSELQIAMCSGDVHLQNSSKRWGHGNGEAGWKKNNEKDDDRARPTSGHFFIAPWKQP